MKTRFLMSRVYLKNKATGVTYVYECVSFWDKSKKKPASKRTCMVAVGTMISQRPPHRSVRAELLHTAPTSDTWRQTARADADAGSSHSESIDRSTAGTVPRSSGLAGSAAEARGASARSPEPESRSDYPYCRELRDS